MTVAEFKKHYCQSKLKIMSGYNGKVLCQDYDDKKHPHIADREIDCVWAEIKIVKSTFGDYAEPIMCAYVDGKQEYMKDKGAE